LAGAQVDLKSVLGGQYAAAGLAAAQRPQGEDKDKGEDPAGHHGRHAE
jgi:hypothetical protein